jgi:hypothetical protein
MGKNFTDLSPADLEQLIRDGFAARGRAVTDVSFAIIPAYDPGDHKPNGLHEIDSVRVSWEEAKPKELNPGAA